MPDRYTALRAFWQMPLGKSLLTAEAQLLGEALEDVFGWEFLQVGRLGRGPGAAGRLPHPPQDRGGARAPSAAGPTSSRGPRRCPSARDSVDAVLLPHTPGVRLRPLCHRARGRPGALRGRAAGGAGLPALQPLGHAGAQLARRAFRRACAASSPPAGCANGWCCWAMKSSPPAPTCIAPPGGAGRRATAQSADHSPVAAPHLVQSAARRGLDAEGPQAHPRPDPDPAAPAREAAGRHRPAGEAHHPAAALDGGADWSSIPMAPVAAIPGPGGWGALLELERHAEGTVGRGACHHQQSHGTHRGDHGPCGTEAADARRRCRRTPST